jgi:hypothetical protein
LIKKQGNDGLKKKQKRWDGQKGQKVNKKAKNKKAKHQGGKRTESLPALPKYTTAHYSGYRRKPVCSVKNEEHWF